MYNPASYPGCDKRIIVFMIKKKRLLVLGVFSKDPNPANITSGLSFVEISVSSSLFTESSHVSLSTVSWCKHGFPSKRRELTVTGSERT